ncbi:MAG: restriction endonuclease, partial [Muribaculaceae bacterium]|nr:restriction endonuclease [Muribaculaceae bacterium]
LAFLNNRRVFEWIAFNRIVKGAIVEFSEAPIASIPYRPINWSDAEEVRMHDEIKEEVTLYLNDNSSAHIDKINMLFDKLFL